MMSAALSSSLSGSSARACWYLALASATLPDALSASPSLRSSWMAALDLAASYSDLIFWSVGSSLFAAARVASASAYLPMLNSAIPWCAPGAAIHAERQARARSCSSRAARAQWQWQARSGSGRHGSCG